MATNGDRNLAIDRGARLLKQGKRAKKSISYTRMSPSPSGRLRSEVSHLAADWLADAGHSLWVIAWKTINRDAEAVALATQMVGQLGQAAATVARRLA